MYLLIEILISFSSVNNNLIHISDWLPTLLHIAKVDGFEKIIKDLDGIDQYENIFTPETVSSRKEIVHDLNILSQTGKYYGALQIEGGWKLILNAEKNELENKYELFNVENDPEETIDWKESVPDLFQYLKHQLEVFH